MLINVLVSFSIFWLFINQKLPKYVDHNIVFIPLHFMSVENIVTKILKTKYGRCINNRLC